LTKPDKPDYDEIMGLLDELKPGLQWFATVKYNLPGIKREIKSIVVVDAPTLKEALDIVGNYCIPTQPGWEHCCRPPIPNDAYNCELAEWGEYEDEDGMQIATTAGDAGKDYEFFVDDEGQLVLEVHNLFYDDVCGGISDDGQILMDSEQEPTAFIKDDQIEVLRD
jgi:hypothetical protein